MITEFGRGRDGLSIKIRLATPESFSWNWPEHPLLGTSFHGTRRHHSSFQSKELIKVTHSWNASKPSPPQQGTISLRKQQRHENRTPANHWVLVSSYGGGPPVTVKPARSLTAFYTFVLDPRTSVVLFILSQDASVCIRQKQLWKTTTNPNVEL